ncbi:MAG TPA: hypothetical protein VLD67_00145, partial [Vicinamibacterales bacterium]|nr:hypothetical protein [Vicinamibacterales bacterium]
MAERRRGMPLMPPWIRAAARLLPARYRAEILGDLVDEHAAMIAGGTPRPAAAAWLAAHVLRSALAARLAASRRRGLHAAFISAWGTVMPAGEWRQAVRSL